MSVTTLEPVMAKDAKYTTVKIRTDILRKARVIVAIRDVLLSDYLSDCLEQVIDRDHSRALDEATRGKGKRNGHAS